MSKEMLKEIQNSQLKPAIIDKEHLETNVELHPLLKQKELVVSGDSISLKRETESKLEELRLRVAQNREDGRLREEKYFKTLQKDFPAEKGFSILRESYLRDANGNIAIDKESGEKRRLDFVVVKENQPFASFELTSLQVDKTLQIAKENRIREHGGNFIKDNESQAILEIPSNIRTEIIRMN